MRLEDVTRDYVIVFSSQVLYDIPIFYSALCGIPIFMDLLNAQQSSLKSKL